MLSALPAGTVIDVCHVYDGWEWHCTPLGVFHNHSRTPNARNVRVGGKRYLVTARDVQPGEEITVDYRLQPDLEQPRASWL